MSDTISRQAAIDAYGDWYVEEGTEEGFIGTVKQLLERLPSAQPEVKVLRVPCAEKPIDMFDALSEEEKRQNKWYAEGYGDAMKELSAQPEIIRCKDCKYWMPYDWMFNKIWQSQNINDYSEDEISCKYCDMRMKADDFCSRSERREE